MTQIRVMVVQIEQTLLHHYKSDNVHAHFKLTNIRYDVFLEGVQYNLLCRCPNMVVITATGVVYVGNVT